MNMKKFGLFLACAFALMAIASCANEEEYHPDGDNETGGETYGAPEITVETTEWNAPAVGALTTEIAVDASDDWTAESADIWLAVTKGDDSITLTASENGDTTERETKVTLTCTDGTGTAYECIAVTQDGMAYLNLGTEAVSFGNSACEANVTVESNFDWDYSYDSSNGWFTVSKNTDGLTVSVVADDDDDREGIVTLSAGDGAENVAEAELEISQSGITAMILTYTITSANTTTQLPLYGDVDCTVDWGDGTVETITSSQPSHTDADAGEYDISINGTMTRLYSYGISTSGSPLPVTAVKQWGRTGLTSLNHAFYYGTKLVSLPEITGDSFAEVTDASYMFYNCSALESVPSGLFDYASSATTFAKLFFGCSALKGIPSEGIFGGCSAARSFEECFRGCSSLTALPAGLFDDCAAVTDMSYLCHSCGSLTTIPAGLFDNCTKVTTFSYCFYNCSALESIPSGLFDYASSVTTFADLFYGCSALKEIPAGLFDNCTKVTNFSYCFHSCSALESIPSGLFAYASSATTFADLFYGCSVLKEIPAGLFDNCTKVTNFSYCFYNCSALESIPSGLFDHATSATTFADLFFGCSALKEIPAGLFDNCTEVTTFGYGFYGCKTLKEIPANLFINCTKVTNFSYCFNSGNSSTHNLTGESAYDLQLIDGIETMIHLYERADHTDIYTKPSNTTYCYRYQTELDDYGSLPTGWY